MYLNKKYIKKVLLNRDFTVTTFLFELSFPPQNFILPIFSSLKVTYNHIVLSKENL